MRIVGIVQARMGSTRLPGKVLSPLAGHSVLSWTVRAARESRALDEIVVATTTDAADDAVVTECDRLGVASFRGPVDDVLTRFTAALGAHPADAVVRFTADCPLLDPSIVAVVARLWHIDTAIDYISTALPRTLPRGMDVELISAAALRRVAAQARDHHRVHVTSFAYTHPEQFGLLGVTFPPDDSDLRVTLDTTDDLALITAVVEALGDRPASRRTLVRWLRQHPDVCALNAHIEQKSLDEG